MLQDASDQYPLGLRRPRSFSRPSRRPPASTAPPVMSLPARALRDAAQEKGGSSARAVLSRLPPPEQTFMGRRPRFFSGRLEGRPLGTVAAN